MSCAEFTDDEIREELAHLGYHDVPQDKLEDFKKDLIKLISKERSKTNSLNSSRTAEDDSAEQEYERQQFINEGHLNERDFTNHGNQWTRGNTFNEDWQYLGEKEYRTRPKTAPQRSGQTRMGQMSESRSDYDSAYPSPSAAYVRRNQCNNRDDASECGSESRCMKRKTSRKTSDGCHVVDESFTDTDSGLFEIYEKIRNLAMRECECGKSRSKSGDVEPPYRIKGKNKNPSVIKKKIEPPHTRNLVKMDQNERHKMYREGWKARPPIGEDHRIALRKAMQAKLLRHDEIKVKQKVYIPNVYVPPHEKLRRDVRWQVRQAFENFELPEHGFYHDI